MHKLKIKIWSREFDIPVIYSCYPGESILPEQKEAIELFAKNNVAIEESLDDLVKYVISTSDGEIENSQVDNIFKYVMPRSLFVPRTKEPIVAIICDYKFDMENGISVVFKDNKLSEIGTQDIIL